MHSGARPIGLAACAIFLCVVTLSVPGCGRTKPTRGEVIDRYSQELREAVSANVHEEGRKSRMLLVVDQLEALNVRFDQETADFIASYRKLNGNYDAARSAFEQLFSDYSAKRVQARSEALDMHFQLASLATADEWDSIVKAEAKLYEEVNVSRFAPESTK